MYTNQANKSIKALDARFTKLLDSSVHLPINSE